MKLSVYLPLATLLMTMSLTAMEVNVGDAPQLGNTFTLIYPFTHFIEHYPALIGIYGSPYRFIPTLARIQLDPKMMHDLLPATLKKQITFPSTDINLNVEFQRATPGSYNMVFHPWAQS